MRTSSFSAVARAGARAGLALLLLVVAASAQDSSAIWPQPGYDSTHSGRSPYVGTSVGALRWSYATGTAVQTSPVIGADGTVYVGTGVALNGATGEPMWTSFPYSISFSLQGSVTPATVALSGGSYGESLIVGANLGVALEMFMQSWESRRHRTGIRRRGGSRSASQLPTPIRRPPRHRGSYTQSLAHLGPFMQAQACHTGTTTRSLRYVLHTHL
jgi:hypothetical protein